MSFQQKKCKIFTITKYHLWITIGFFLITSYTAFFHHPYWTIFDQDGLIYLQLGRTIITGNGENAALFNAGPGGPIFFASLEKVFGDGFSVIKVVSILSGTGIVFFSFYVIRNIFNYKTAIVGQLFVAFNPWLGIFSTHAHNELVTVFLSM